MNWKNFCVIKMLDGIEEKAKQSFIDLLKLIFDVAKLIIKEFISSASSVFKELFNKRN